MDNPPVETPGEDGSPRNQQEIADVVSSLAPRELEVLELLATGLTLKEIANTLNLSFHTIREYTERIYRKFQVHSRAQAVAKLREAEKRQP